MSLRLIPCSSPCSRRRASLTGASPAPSAWPCSPHLAAAPLRSWPWRKLTFGDAIAEVLGRGALAGGEVQDERTLIFGDAPATRDALRITFDGWIAKVGPMATVPRLAEREYFSVAGILAASLALSELFLSFAEISLEATRRTVGISLWRPDLDIGDPEALGMPIEYLPRELWVLGLGHLGNAYLWSLATLPYADPKAVEFALFDFDKVERDNLETGIILTADFLDRFKSRAAPPGSNAGAFARSSSSDDSMRHSASRIRNRGSRSAGSMPIPRGRIWFTRNSAASSTAASAA